MLAGDTHGTAEEVRSSCAFHIAPAEAVAGRVAVSVAAAVEAIANSMQAIIIEGRINRIRLVDRAPPPREMRVWSIHSYAVSQAAARRVSRRVHQDVHRAQADPQSVQVVVTDDLNVALEGEWPSQPGRTRVAAEVMPNAPSDLDAAKVRGSSIDRIFLALPRSAW